MQALIPIPHPPPRPDMTKRGAPQYVLSVPLTGVKGTDLVDSEEIKGCRVLRPTLTVDLVVQFMHSGNEKGGEGRGGGGRRQQTVRLE